MRILIFIILWFVFGFLGGYTYDVFVSDVVVSPYIMVISFLVSILLTIAIHEIGHYIAAKISGYRFVMYRIFSIAFIKEDGKIKRKKFSIPGTLGQNLMVPKQSLTEDYPYLLYHLGGVILNLITVVVSLIVLFMATGVIKVFAYHMMIIGIVAAVTNGVPVSASINNDGRNALDSYKNKSHRLLIHASLVACERYLKGVSGNIWSEEELKVLFDSENTKYLEFGAFMVDYYSERGDFKKAEEIAEESVSKPVLSSELQRQVLIGEVLFFKLVNRDEEAIEKYNTKEFKKFRKRVLKALINRFHIEYAFALYERDYEKAEKIKREFESYRMSYPFEGQSIGISKLMEYAKKLGER